MLDPVTDHEDAGAGLLSEQFKQQPKIVALLKSWLEQVQLLEDDADTLRLQRMLEHAVGVNVDILGALVGQRRGSRSDELYKIWIAARALVNRSSGKTTQLIAIAAKLCDGPVWLEEFQPATFVMHSVDPIVGADGVEIARLLKLAKAGGVAMQFRWHDVLTSFRFSPTGASVYDSDWGFGAGRFAAVSDGRDMGFDPPVPPVSGGGGGGGALLVVL
jgi:hypothetical protein